MPHTAMKTDVKIGIVNKSIYKDIIEITNDNKLIIKIVIFYMNFLIKID